MKRFARTFALIALAAPALFANTKSEVVLEGKPHMEFDCPSNTPLKLLVRSGEILIVGSDDNKITVDLAGKNADKIQDVKGRLSVTNNVAELHLTGGPKNELQIIIHVPKNSDLTARVFAGDVSVQDVIGNKDFELHAGQLTISVDKPEEYGHVDMSVNAGQVDAEVFGDSKGGLFRSISRETGGKYRLHAHVGTGQLSVR
jgi:putative adhesin